MNELWNNVEQIFLGDQLGEEAAGVETTIAQTWPWTPWVLLALMIGFALSSPPGKPKVAFYSEVPTGKGRIAFGN